jgi:hypothetical protein
MADGRDSLGSAMGIGMYVIRDVSMMPGVGLGRDVRQQPTDAPSTFLNISGRARASPYFRTDSLSFRETIG